MNLQDVERMMICTVCGDDAVCGFGVTLDGIRMGDVGDWRCAEHHPHRKARYTRQEWAQACAEGLEYPTPSNEVEEINTGGPDAWRAEVSA